LSRHTAVLLFISVSSLYDATLRFLSTRAPTTEIRQPWQQILESLTRVGHHTLHPLRIVSLLQSLRGDAENAVETLEMAVLAIYVVGVTHVLPQSSS
jgi:hypothetical protein